MSICRAQRQRRWYRAAQGVSRGGWGIDEVRGYLHERGIVSPKRTDCARCFLQRLSEWCSCGTSIQTNKASAEADEELQGLHTARPDAIHRTAGLHLRRAFRRGFVHKGCWLGSARLWMREG